jgi:hypothetical protein
LGGEGFVFGVRQEQKVKRQNAKCKRRERKQRKKGGSG